MTIGLQSLIAPVQNDKTKFSTADLYHHKNETNSSYLVKQNKKFNTHMYCVCMNLHM